MTNFPHRNVRITCPIVLLWLRLCTTLFASQFTTTNVDIPGLRHAAVAWGDFDNDNRLDLLVSGNSSTGPITRVYRNDGSNKFADIQAGLPGISQGAVGCSDYNGDGYLDFAVTGMSSTGPITRIYRNNGNASFSNINGDLPGLESSRLTWGDYDNDGDLDLFVTGYTGSAYVARICRNDGQDRFSNAGVTAIAGGAAGATAWADYDNDGDQDLLFAGFTSDTTYGQSSRLYRNDKGAFTRLSNITLTPMSACSAAWADYDNDGNLDLLMAGSSIGGVQSHPTLRLYRNSNNGSNFTSMTTGIPGAQDCSVAWGDFDNDGFTDVAIAGYNNDFVPFAAIHRNLGNDIFADSGAGLTGVIDTAVAWGDPDGDGDLDLFVTGFDGSTSTTRLYRNDTALPNAVPSPPWDLKAAVSARSATFSWSPGADPNQSGGFTYNLRVGTSPGADDVMPSQANSVTGFRRLPALGNAGERLSWTVKLPVGTYYWTVQAIDHAWEGSRFAPEQMLLVPPQAPDASTLTATNLNLTEATLRGAVNPNGDATVIYFEYGTNNSYGATTPPQNIGSGVAEVDFSALITRLLPAVTYQYRVVAGNSFGVTVGAPQSFFTPLFTEMASISLEGAVSGSTAWGDYDNDGYLDVLIAGGNSTGAVTRIYHNQGGTNLVEIQAGLPGVSDGGQAAWGDYDNDGRLDLLLTGSGISRVYHNDGGSIFTDVKADLPSLSTGASGAWADFNNDGNLDFAIAGAGGFPLKTYRNDGAGGFTDLATSLPLLSDSSMAWADFDNNGAMDLLVTGYNYGAGGLGDMTRLYLTDGRGNFTNSNNTFQRISRGSVAWGDYNNDGLMDLLLTGSSASGFNRYSIIYSNNGAGSFVSRSPSTVAKMDQSCVAWGDYNNDGALDFAASGMTSTGAVVKVYRNDGGTVFHDSGAALPGLSNASLAWGDFDNDGRLDLLVTGYNSSTYVARLFRNNSIATNTAPSPPANLTSAVVSNSVTLTWDPAFDINQSGGLTYNVRLGTTPGASDALGPMADTATGFRRLPRLGNAGSRWSLTLTNLVIGSYHWSVQAIDHNYAGSLFSSNGTFSITAALLPPAAITKGTTNLGLANATLEGASNPKGTTALAFFEYGTTTNLGSATRAQLIGSGITNVAVSATLGPLSDGTTYYFRMVASNFNGTAVGKMLSFTTGYQFSNVVTELPRLGSGNSDWAGCVAWGDYDMDGDLDLAASGVSLAGTHLYRNDGMDLFTLVNSNLPAAHYGTLEWGDYNRDSYPDLLAAGSSGLAVARNNGDCSFAVVTITNINEDIRGKECGYWVDYDNDGDLDISCYDHVDNNQSYAQARLYHNDNGSFVPSGVPLPKLTGGWMAWGDYDGDGLPDLAVTGQIIITNYIHPSTRIYHNEGDGIFTDINASLVGLERSRVIWGDLDNDGDLDLLCGGFASSGYQTLLYLNNDGALVEASSGLPASHGLMSCADYDNDGTLDVSLTFIGWYDTTNRIYRNQGHGIFTDSGKYFLAGPAWYTRISSVAWADYDLDHDLDMLIGTQLYRNNNSAANIPPQAPDGLCATRDGNVVTLRWNAPVDPNQSNALTYNLQVGTVPEAYDVLSPESDSDGWRRVAKPGIASRPTWKLVLPVGIYYWKVQAIDSALAGSPFSGEATFAIPEQAPRVLTLSATTNSAGYPILNGSVNPNGPPTTAWFEYGLTNFEFRTEPQVLTGTKPASITALTGLLEPNLSYGFRLVASNSLGRTVGLVRNFLLPFFTDRTVNLPAGDRYILAAADFDNDGAPDVLLQGYYGVKLYHNDNGVITNATADFARVAQASVACADYDNDGDLDLLLTGLTDWQRFAKLYRNEGSSRFLEVPLPLIGVYRTSATWADFDNDGKLDLLVNGLDSWDRAVIQMCRNDGNDVFTAIPVPFPAPSDGAFLTCADYDKDGRVDILLAGVAQDTRICRLYHNNGDLSFSDSGHIFPGFENGSASWGDYDGDGWLDLLVNGAGGTNYLTKVFRNLGTRFEELPLNLSGVIGGSAWLDYDNDGKLDILLRGFTDRFEPRSYSTWLLRNLGNSQFADSEVQLPPGRQHSARIWSADFDRDGDSDLLTQEGDLLRNESPISNVVPSAPVALKATVNQSSVTLTWQSGLDPNQSGGHTYNVRVGTSPGGQDVVTPMSSAMTGERLFPSLGNAFTRTNLFLDYLKVGTYFWSVQCIDHVFAASAFAPEQAFTIPPHAPSIRFQTVSNIAAESAVLTARLNPNGASTRVWFEYGLSTNYGVPTSIQDLGSGTDWVDFSASIDSLEHVAVYHYRVVASNSFGVTYGKNITFSTPQFSEVDLGIYSSARSFVVGDFNRDSRLDFVATVPGADYASLWLNNAIGGFTNQGVQPRGSDSAIDATDYDNDGYLDLAMSVNSTTSLPGRVHHNLGDNTFLAIDLPLSDPSYSLSWGDYDNDGRPDLLSSGGDGWRIYRNLGSDGFVLATRVHGSSTMSAWADYDNDGLLDFITAGSSTGPFTRLMRNTGTNGFVDSGVVLPQVHGRPYWADFDNDGRQDLLLADVNWSGGLHLCHNLGNGVFIEVTNAFPVIQQGKVSWGDFDNDGRLDLLATGYLDRFQVGLVFRNEGNGVFTDLGLRLNVFADCSAGWGDFDDDGDLDFVLSTGPYNNNTVRLYRNNNPRANSPPGAPTGLVSTVSGSAATLSWEPATDANQSDGLSYNLRIGTGPGRADILNPASDLASGWRQLARIGNVQHDLRWTITNLPPGLYYWSVQAVDNSYAGSPFAPEMSFACGNLPIAHSQHVILPEDSSRAITLAGSDPNGAELAFELLTPPAHGLLFGTPPAVLFQPATNFFGLDSFTFLVHNGLSTSLPAEVTLEITPVPDVLSSLLEIRGTKGQFTLTLTGEPYDRYGIEASPDLIDWGIITNVFSTNGAMIFLDPDADAYEQRFYRSVRLSTPP